MREAEDKRAEGLEQGRLGDGDLSGVGVGDILEGATEGRGEEEATGSGWGGGIIGWNGFPFQLVEPWEGEILVELERFGERLAEEFLGTDGLEFPAEGLLLLGRLFGEGIDTGRQVDQADLLQGLLFGDLPEGAVAVVAGIGREEGEDMGTDEEDGAGGAGGGVEKIFLGMDTADEEFDRLLVGPAEEDAALGVVEAEAGPVGFGRDIGDKADGFGDFHKLIELPDDLGIGGERAELVLGIGKENLPLAAFEFLEGDGNLIHTDLEAIPLIGEEPEEAFFAEIGLSGAELLDEVSGDGEGGGPYFAGGVEGSRVIFGGGEAEGLAGGGPLHGEAEGISGEAGRGVREG